MNLFVAVLREAEQEFGHPRTWNRPMVTAWVRNRMAVLMGKVEKAPPTIKKPTLAVDNARKPYPEEWDRL